MGLGHRAQDPPPAPAAVAHQIDFEDRYKKYRLWQDPERVLAETTPCQQANRVDPARARDLVTRTFGRDAPAPDRGNAPAS